MLVLEMKQRTEAPVNGGRNYNGPKVAKFLVGKMQVTRDWTERPHGALLQLGIGLWHITYRIAGRLGNLIAR